MIFWMAERGWVAAVTGTYSRLIIPQTKSRSCAQKKLISVDQYTKSIPSIDTRLILEQLNQH